MHAHQMFSQKLCRLIGIARAQTLQNRAAAFAKVVHRRRLAHIDQPRQQACDAVREEAKHLVAGCGRQKIVEVRDVSGVAAPLAARNCGFQTLDVLLDGVEIFFLSALAGEPDHQFGDENACLGEIAHRDAAEVDHVFHGLGEWRAFLEQEGTALGTLAQGDQSGYFERAQRFTYRRAADAELSGEIALRRQLVSGPDLALGKLVPDLIADLLEQPRAAHDVEADRRLHVHRHFHDPLDPAIRPLQANGLTILLSIHSACDYPPSPQSGRHRWVSRRRSLWSTTAARMESSAWRGAPSFRTKSSSATSRC